jgi:hypothetical protein
MQKSSEMESATAPKMSLSRRELFDVVNLAKNREEPVVLSPQGLDVSFFCLIGEASQENVTLRNPIPANFVRRLQHVKEYLLFCRSYQIRFEKLEPFGTDVRFDLPEFAEINQSRQRERVHFSPKENAIVQIQHPFDTSTVLKRKVFDLSSGGMSFRARRKTPFIQPGRILNSCEIFIQGVSQEKKQGRVVYIKQIIDINSDAYYQVGVQFVEPGSQEKE